jgi:hypothetical protein
MIRLQQFFRLTTSALGLFTLNLLISTFAHGNYMQRLFELILGSRQCDSSDLQFEACTAKDSCIHWRGNQEGTTCS